MSDHKRFINISDNKVLGESNMDVSQSSGAQSEVKIEENDIEKLNLSMSQNAVSNSTSTTESVVSRNISVVNNVVKKEADINITQSGSQTNDFIEVKNNVFGSDF